MAKSDESPTGVPPTSTGAAPDQSEKARPASADAKATDGDAPANKVDERPAVGSDPLLDGSRADARVPAAPRRDARIDELRYDRDGLFLTDDELDYGPRRPVRRRRRRQTSLWDPDTNDRVVDGTADVGRAVAVGYMSQMRLMADVASNFASTVIDGSLTNGRNRRTRARSSSRERVGRRTRPSRRRREYEYEYEYEPATGRDYDGYERAVAEDDTSEDAPVRRGREAVYARDDRYDDSRDRYWRDDRYERDDLYWRDDRYGRGNRNGRGRRYRWGEDAADFADDVVDGFLDAWDDVMDIPRVVAEDMADSYDRDDYRRRDGYDDDREPDYDRRPRGRDRRR